MSRAADILRGQSWSLGPEGYVLTQCRDHGATVSRGIRGRRPGGPQVPQAVTAAGSGCMAELMPNAGWRSHAGIAGPQLGWPVRQAPDRGGAEILPWSCAVGSGSLELALASLGVVKGLDGCAWQVTGPAARKVT